MKLVTHKTDAIIIKAQTFGDIENANYALVSIDDKFINASKANKEIAYSLKKGEVFKFCKLVYYAGVICWFEDNDLNLPKNKPWSYIEIIQEEIDKLNCPNNFISNVSVIEFDHEGFRYVDSEEESNEYFTQNVNPDEL